MILDFVATSHEPKVVCMAHGYLLFTLPPKKLESECAPIDEL